MRCNRTVSRTGVTMTGALLKELFDRAPVGVAVLDQELRYLYVNGALAKLNGVPVEEHLGQALEDVLPDLAAEARDAFNLVLRSEQPLRDWEITGETPAARGEERHWLENVYPLRAAGEVVGLGAVVIDITDRRRAEDGLRASEERFQALVDGMDDIVFSLDRYRRYTGVWGRWLERHGLRQEDFLGKNAADVVGGELAAPDRHHSERALKGEQVVYEREATDGRFFQTSLSPLERNGRVDGLVGVGRDITALREAQRKLERQRERAQRLLGQLERGLTPRAQHPRRWRCAWRYFAASEEMLLGGDFLGFIERPDGSLTFVIGDVAGRGPAAAGVGAALRAGWRALVEAGVPLEDLLPTLAPLLSAYRDGTSMFATLCCGRLSGMQPRLEIASAGHHPPLLVSTSGASALEHEIGPALGISGVVPRWEVTSIDVEPDAALVLFTDGAFEGRTRSGRRLGYERLADLMPRELATGDAVKRLDQLLNRLMSANRGPLEDDVALMLLSAPPHPTTATRRN
jgi:PAS domain S-box-containing protein